MLKESLNIDVPDGDRDSIDKLNSFFKDIIKNSEKTSEDFYDALVEPLGTDSLQNYLTTLKKENGNQEYTTADFKSNLKFFYHFQEACKRKLERIG